MSERPICSRYSSLFDEPGQEAGVCDPQCDPLTQRRGGDNAEACGSPAPAAPAKGCYTTDRVAFSCSNVPAAAACSIAVDMTGTAQPVVEHDGRRHVLRPFDEIAAGKLRRNRPAPEPDDDAEATVPSDPAGALLDRLVGPPPRHRAPEED